MFRPESTDWELLEAAVHVGRGHCSQGWMLASLLIFSSYFNPSKNYLDLQRLKDGLALSRLYLQVLVTLLHLRPSGCMWDDRSHSVNPGCKDD